MLSIDIYNNGYFFCFVAPAFSLYGFFIIYPDYKGVLLQCAGITTPKSALNCREQLTNNMNKELLWRDNNL